jgi:hypothetical protein
MNGLYTRYDRSTVFQYGWLYTLGTRNWNFSFFTCNGFRVGCKDYNK